MTKTIDVDQIRKVRDRETDFSWGKCVYRRMMAYYKDSYNLLERRLCPIDMTDIDYANRNSKWYYRNYSMWGWLSSNELGRYHEKHFPEFLEAMKFSEVKTNKTH